MALPAVKPDLAAPYAGLEGAPTALEKSVSPADRKLRIINLFAVLLPIAGLGLAIALTWGTAFNWTQFSIMTGMSIATALGITIGFHRLATHQSFRTSKVLKYVFGAAGSMAVQGPIIQWAGAHRRHHQHSDDVLDPHSPHAHVGGSWGNGIAGLCRGAYHAHVGWLFAGHPKGLGKYTRDLRQDPALCAIDRQFVMWVLIGLALPAVLGGLITMSFYGALLGFLWGGLTRILIVHHITWSVNSVCHLWGSRPYRCGDESRNNPIVGILAFGEGWHNNHHAFPASARHGMRWWELDISYMVIRALWVCGLVRDIRLPDRERRELKRRR